MFGIGRRKHHRGLFSARTGLMSAAALGLAYVGKKLWNKRKGGSGLRESYSESSEWTPDTSASSERSQTTPSYG